MYFWNLLQCFWYYIYFDNVLQVRYAVRYILLTSKENSRYNLAKEEDLMQTYKQGIKIHREETLAVRWVFIWCVIGSKTSKNRLGLEAITFSVKVIELISEY